MQIVSTENNIDEVTQYISENFTYQKIAFFVDDNNDNINLVRKIQKQLVNNPIIENSTLTEDVAFCFVCGSFRFQQDSLIEITYNNVKYGYLVTDLEQCSFLSPYIQDENLIQIYMPEIIYFEKNSIKNQKFISNLGVYSYIQSKRISIFEMEFYSKVFNRCYILEFKNKLLYICDSFGAIMEQKIKNIKNTNGKILELVIKYIKLQDKYQILYKNDSIFSLSNSLSGKLFRNFYENFYISSVFATSLYQKFFMLSFKNNYTFDYTKQLQYCVDDFLSNIEDFKSSTIDDGLNYKIYVNKDYFNQELTYIFTKYFLQKYDFLCIFEDFGYNLTKKLEKSDIYIEIRRVANLKGESLFKQIRNYGLLDF